MSVFLRRMRRTSGWLSWRGPRQITPSVRLRQNHKVTIQHRKNTDRSPAGVGQQTAKCIGKDLHPPVLHRPGRPACLSQRAKAKATPAAIVMLTVIDGRRTTCHGSAQGRRCGRLRGLEFSCEEIAFSDAISALVDGSRIRLGGARICRVDISPK